MIVQYGQTQVDTEEFEHMTLQNFLEEGGVDQPELSAGSAEVIQQKMMMMLASTAAATDKATHQRLTTSLIKLHSNRVYWTCKMK